MGTDPEGLPRGFLDFQAENNDFGLETFSESLKYVDDPVSLGPSRTGPAILTCRLARRPQGGASTGKSCFSLFKRGVSLLLQ